MDVLHIVATPAAFANIAAGTSRDMQEQSSQAFLADVPGWVAATGNWVVGAPLRILIIAVVSLIALALLHRTITTVTERIIRGGGRPEALARTEFGAAILEASTLESPRREQRVRTLGTVLRSTSNILVTTIAVLLILDELRINIAPFVASAGIVGVALGFGAQSLVKDFLSGIFLLMEDQYGVGDRVQVGDVVGTVESVALRVTRLRDVDGVLWIIRNGEILKVGNKTQGWARASVPVRVSYDSELPTVYDALRQVCENIAADESISSALHGPPAAGGIEEMTSLAVTIRVSARTDPDRVWDVTVALRKQVRSVFEERNINLAPEMGRWIDG